MAVYNYYTEEQSTVWEWEFVALFEGYQIVGVDAGMDAVVTTE